MINIVERETKPEAAAKVSNDDRQRPDLRIRAPEGDPRRITDLTRSMTPTRRASSTSPT
jgi:hypothetical protein